MASIKLLEIVLYGNIQHNIPCGRKLRGWRRRYCIKRPSGTEHLTQAPEQRSRSQRCLAGHAANFGAKTQRTRGGGIMVVVDVNAAAIIKGESMALSEEPIIAWHFIFCIYGFWLPNDPRGSWSRFVRSPEIYAVGGPATGSGKIRRSVAGLQHDRVSRNAAKVALKYPSVKFSGIQARAVARGIGAAVHENKYRVHACAIMPDHVHILMDIQSRKTEHVVGHLKARATQQINDEHIHPSAGHATSAARTPKPQWRAAPIVMGPGTGCWNVRRT